METVTGLCLPLRHTLHRKKARVGAHLASASPYDNIDEKEQTEVWNPLLLLRMMDDNG